MPVAELVSRAKVSFREIQNEMQALAGLVAAERGLPSGDYRDVIAELKKDQLVGEAILPHYQKRIGQLEDLIEEHHVVTVPDRDMRIRLASEAESAAGAGAEHAAAAPVRQHRRDGRVRAAATDPR